MDRLGDLICTLPVDQHPELQSTDHSVTWLISNGLEQVAECATPKRKLFSQNKEFSWERFKKLVQILRSSKYDQAILFFAPWWIGLACFLAKIPKRYSPRSRWYQILFFNHTLRQKRSLSDKHESIYNWELLHWALTGNLAHIPPMPYLELKAPTPSPVPLLPAEFIVIHPGMGGSALNWPSHLYLSLITLLVELGKKVVITGTKADEPWLKDLEGPIKGKSGVHWLVGQLDLQALIYVLGKSQAVVAPSTGVLHLAASTGVKTLGIYSPIRVQTPIRWGPRGKQAKAFVPNVKCPAQTRCLEKKCSLFPCLENISPQFILKEIFSP